MPTLIVSLSVNIIISQAYNFSADLRYRKYKGDVVSGFFNYRWLLELGIRQGQVYTEGM